MSTVVLGNDHTVVTVSTTDSAELVKGDNDLSTSYQGGSVIVKAEKLCAKSQAEVDSSDRIPDENSESLFREPVQNDSNQNPLVHPVTNGVNSTGAGMSKKVGSDKSPGTKEPTNTADAGLGMLYNTDATPKPQWN